MATTFPIELRTRLDTLAQLNLECDGLSRVISHLLVQAHLDHEVHTGEIRHQIHGTRFQPHYWIELDGLRIDYRARMWLGPADTTIGHGIMALSDVNSVSYQSFHVFDPVAWDCGETMFTILTTPW